MISRAPVSSSQKFRYFVFYACVLLSAYAWFQFTFPRFSQIDLTVTRPMALRTATEFVQDTQNIDVGSYKNAIVFDVDNQADRYLQRAIGFKRENQFLKDHEYDLFRWSVRFFKEGQKEEYKVVISSRTNEIISYTHVLDEAASRPEINETEAQQKAQEFLENNFKYSPNEWAFNSKVSIKFDHRMEYKFTWEKRNVYVPWNSDPKNGGGKLLTTVNVAGREIQGYNKQTFSVPEEFNRYVERSKESGRNLGLIANIGSLCLVIGAIWVILSRRNHLTMNVTKRFYLVTIALLFVLSILSALNNAQGYLFSYPTTQPFVPFLVRQAVYEIMDRFLFLICFIIPCLAGELLRFEVFPRKPHMSMYRYITTTFFSRDLARTILLGYCFAVVLIGLQTIIFEFGFRYCDVWVEQGRLSRFSSAYFPFLGVFILAANASITEETFYRLFGLNFAFKFFKNPMLAILIPCLIWGLGHTGYMVFPFWFRGLEVTLLGIFTAFVYLRFGLICVVVQHFLFDAFWASSPYIFGKSANSDFWMSLFVLALPFIFALIAFIRNQIVEPKDIEWKLNKQQKYNLEILKIFIEGKSRVQPFDANLLRVQLIGHGWDVAVIDVAFRQLNVPLSVEHTFSDP